jgi:protein-disulfide isomerase
LVVILLLVVGFAAGMGSGYALWGSSAAQARPAAIAGTPQAPRVEVPIGSAPTWGPADAPITMIEFSDYECVFCRKWQTEVWPAIQKAYPGKIRLVYKDFPLTQIHPNASMAAKAARCANDQGQYWQYHDRLFSGTPFSAAYFESIAADLKLDVAKWKACLNSKQHEDAIEKDYQYGAQLGINGTPTFYINGIQLIGAQPFASFKKIIDQELAGR